MTAAAKDKVVANAPTNAGIDGETPEQRLKRERFDADVAYAQKVAQERLEAPDVDVDGGIGSDELAATIRRLEAKGQVGEDEYVFFGDEKKHQHYIHAGYRPLGEDGEQTRVNELEAFAGKKKLRDRRVTAAGAESKARLQGATAKGLSSVDELGEQMPAEVKARYEAAKRQGLSVGKFGDAAMQEELVKLRQKVAALETANSVAE